MNLWLGKYMLRLASQEPVQHTRYAKEQKKTAMYALSLMLEKDESPYETVCRIANQFPVTEHNGIASLFIEVGQREYQFHKMTRHLSSSERNDLRRIKIRFEQFLIRDRIYHWETFEDELFNQLNSDALQEAVSYLDRSVIEVRAVVGRTSKLFGIIETFETARYRPVFNSTLKRYILEPVEN